MYVKITMRFSSRKTIFPRKLEPAREVAVNPLYIYVTSCSLVAYICLPLVEKSLTKQLFSMRENHLRELHPKDVAYMERRP